jgi:MFS family permease
LQHFSLHALQFLALSFVAPLSCAFNLATSVLFQIGADLGDVDNISWIVSGWSIASAVSFSVAGKLSDVFGRRYVVISGQSFTLIGCVSTILPKAH